MPLLEPFKVVPRDIREWGRWFSTLQVIPDDGSVDTAQMADDAATTSKIPDDAVTTAKIVDRAVTFAKVQEISTSGILGRATAGSGDVEELTAAQAADILEVTDWAFTAEVQLNGTVGFFGVTPTTQIANISDAVTAHALNAVFSDTEVESALDALGTKINSVISALETIGITAT